MAETNLVTIKQIATRIYYIRGIKVMLDRDLAELYEVETRVLNQAVKRQIKRFPDDFMFQLSKAEFKNLKSQFVISKFGVKSALDSIKYHTRVKSRLDPFI